MKTKPASRLFLYNPTCEIAIANATVSFMPNKTLSKFERDLDILPLYFACENDVVLVQQHPDELFLDLLRSVGLPIPECKLLSSALQDQDFLNRKKESLEPWGWSPRIHHVLNVFKDSCSTDFLGRTNAFWKTEFRDLYSRRMALQVLQDFLSKSPSDLYVEQSQIARICTSVSEIENLMQKWKPIVIKAPWSSSGRGLQVLRKACLNTSVIQWINSTLKAQGYVTCETLLDKKHDFSLQYHCGAKGELKFLGTSCFKTNSNGQYLGSRLGGMPNELQDLLSDSTLKELVSGISGALKQSPVSTSYHGFLGVDCMAFTDCNGKMKIQPCVEINLRHNMGLLAIFLENHLAPNSKGMFAIHFNPKSTFDEFHTKMKEQHPFKMENGKWKKGYLPLVSPFQNKSFGAYVLLDC